MSSLLGGGASSIAALCKLPSMFVSTGWDSSALAGLDAAGEGLGELGTFVVLDAAALPGLERGGVRMGEPGGVLFALARTTPALSGRTSPDKLDRLLALPDLDAVPWVSLGVWPAIAPLFR